ncbi:MAG TPA: ArsA family ATPase [Pedococcus sp.]|jgi:arsenite-transporting ATPase
MRVILFTGKGGVGKTTTAAATAVRAARSGVKTLVMSTDAAHSLGDALGVDLTGPGAGPVEVEPGLSALQIHPPDQLDASWRVVQDYLLSVLEALGIDGVVGEELTALPGADELAALLELRTQVESGPWDLVVVDCAPTAETLRLLALPEALAWHLDRLVPAQRGLIRSLRPAAAAATGVPLPGPEVLEVVAGWHRHLRAVQGLLTSDLTSVRLVLTPERVVIAESRRTYTSLGLYGFVVDAVVVNRVFPDAAEETGADGAPDPWRSAWNAAQRTGLEEVRESFAPVPVVVSPYLAHEPIGADALAGLGEAQDPDGRYAASLLEPVAHRGMTVTRTGEGFTLALPLPLATASDVRLQRRDDELLVTVADQRRVVTLPAALRRCVVQGASVREGRLRVRFEPDEEVWPRA